MLISNFVGLRFQRVPPRLSVVLVSAALEGGRSGGERSIHLLGQAPVPGVRSLPGDANLAASRLLGPETDHLPWAS